MTAVAAGSRPTITALCAEVSDRNARADSSGKPNTTPSATSPRRAAVRPPGRGAPQSASSTAAGTAATAARPRPMKVGSSPSTASRVAGSVKLKPSTPSRPSATAMPATLRLDQPPRHVPQSAISR
jgi:hypothetical protein